MQAPDLYFFVWAQHERNSIYCFAVERDVRAGRDDGKRNGYEPEHSVLTTIR